MRILVFQLCSYAILSLVLRGFSAGMISLEIVASTVLGLVKMSSFVVFSNALTYQWGGRRPSKNQIQHLAVWWGSMLVASGVLFGDIFDWGAFFGKSRMNPALPILISYLADVFIVMGLRRRAALFYIGLNLVIFLSVSYVSVPALVIWGFGGLFCCYHREILFFSAEGWKSLLARIFLPTSWGLLGHIATEENFLAICIAAIILPALGLGGFLGFRRVFVARV